MLKDHLVLLLPLCPGKVVSIHLQRTRIVSGGVEPTDEECEWPSDDEKEDEKVAQLSVKLS